MGKSIPSPLWYTQGGGTVNKANNKYGWECLCKFFIK